VSDRVAHHDAIAGRHQLARVPREQANLVIARLPARKEVHRRGAALLPAGAHPLVPGPIQSEELSVVTTRRG
jgi:hypothetical protein